MYTTKINWSDTTIILNIDERGKLIVKSCLVLQKILRGKIILDFGGPRRIILTFEGREIRKDINKFERVSASLDIL